MARKTAPAVSKRPHFRSDWNPLSLVKETKVLGETPSFNFFWKKIGSKRRQVARPNGAMSKLHYDFLALLNEAIERMSVQEKTRLTSLPSARACRTEDNPLKNAKEHVESEYFYITDFSNAYEELDIRNLTVLLMFIFRYEQYREMGYYLHDIARYYLAFAAVEEDPMFPFWESFVKIAFGGFAGQGIAFGSNLSPLLFNLYCEVYLDDRLRYYLEKFKDRQHPEKTFTYTRYVDDLVFSRNLPVNANIRRTIRRAINEAGFPINHRKSKVLIRSKGTVFITKIGLRTLEPIPQLEDEANEIRFVKSVLAFPRWKRRRIEHITKSYEAKAKSATNMVLHWNEYPEQIVGFIAEFLHYLRHVENPGSGDLRTLSKCKRFEEVAAPHLARMRFARRETTNNRKFKLEIHPLEIRT